MFLEAGLADEAAQPNQAADDRGHHDDADGSEVVGNGILRVHRRSPGMKSRYAIKYRSRFGRLRLSETVKLPWFAKPQAAKRGDNFSNSVRTRIINDRRTM